MLIKNLCDYYNIQNKNLSNDTSSEYLSEQHVHYMIMLTEEGEISDIIDIRERDIVKQKNGKEKTIFRPVNIILPKRSQKTAIDLNIIEHRPLYIFGLNYNKEEFTPLDEKNKAKKAHQCFSQGNLEFCKGLNSKIVRAYYRFIEKWKPEDQVKNPYLLAIEKDYTNSYFCFALDGHPEIKLHEDQELLEKFIEEYKRNISSQASVIAMCPIEGEYLPVARIHEKIKGIKGGNPTGCVLVGMKENAYESYGKKQSYNSNLSESTMKKYTSVINKLLTDDNHRIYLDDMTIVFFAIVKDDSNECDLFKFMLNGSMEDRVNDSLKAVAIEMLKGKTGDLKALQANPNVEFCIIGLTPNSSRISQRFIIRNSFGSIIQNIVQHQRDLALEGNIRQIAIWQINNELVSPKSSEKSTESNKVSSSLTSTIFYAILNGTRYPESLLSTVIRRVKTDIDEENNNNIKVNDIRVGIIKACLNRKARFTNNKEVIKMALDLSNNNPAYLCGRLFAALELIQQRAANGKLNRTIKDSFFASACSKPSTVFPRLIILAQNHLAKLKNTTYFDMLIGEIVSQLNSEFPQTLSLDDQGQFIIGYYQQNKVLYEKKDETTKVN